MTKTTRYTHNLAKTLLRQKSVESEISRVVDHIEARKPISQNANLLSENQETRWDRLADNVARVGGSWGFIACFFIFLTSWTLINTLLLVNGSAFDPYPFIFLNLMLSMLAAVQAPIIMMSQNRQAAKDRIAAAHNYEVNLRSEIEILAMQEKLNQMRSEQFSQIVKQHEEIVQKINELKNGINGVPV